jgi:membrane protease subunit (stomatin/prohibitin family)
LRLAHLKIDRLEEQLGSEEAAAIMTAITQAGTIDKRFDRLESQVAEIRSEIVGDHCHTSPLRW